MLKSFCFGFIIKINNNEGVLITMKRIISLFLAVALVFSLTACGGDSSSSGNGGKATIKLEYPYGVTNQPMEVGVTYPYKTLCYQDQDVETTGFVTITSYTVTPADVEGYVNKTLKAKLVYNDDNAYHYGMKSRVLYSDFDQGGDGLMGGADNWTVEVDGKTGEITVLSDFFDSQGWDNRVFVTEYELSLCMPEWYDGIALFFYNAKNAKRVEDGTGTIPDGTPIRDILDGDTQWFIFGSEDQKYYGEDYIKQASDINLDELLNNAPEDLAPFIEDEYEEDEYIPDDADYTYVEIENRNKHTLKRNEKTELKVYYSVYNAFEECYVVAQVCTEDMSKVVYEKTVDAYNPDHIMYTGDVTFTVDGADFDDSDVVNLVFTLYDFEGFDISAGYMDIPLE